MKPTPFNCVSGSAAAMLEDNIDTDIIFPARFLLLTAREGLGVHAFHDRRYHTDGSEVADYVLNQPAFRQPAVVLAGANFGSGSSREQAVWALHDLGVRAVIAPGFGEIFYNNCLRNGIVPVTLSEEMLVALSAAAAAGKCFTVDLESQLVRVEGLSDIAFDISPERRLALLNGWDETDQIVNRHAKAIGRFESEQRLVQPWLYQGSAGV